MSCNAYVYDVCYTNPITINYKPIIQKGVSSSGKIEQGEKQGIILLKLPDENGLVSYKIEVSYQSSSVFGPDDNSFLFYVPDEDERYIFSIRYVFDLKKDLYYSENGTTENIVSATPVYCRQGASGIDFDMTNFIPPYPIVSEVSSNNKILIRKILKTQDIEYNVFLCFYDEKNLLQKLVQEKAYFIEGDHKSIDLNAAPYKQSTQDAHSIKIFVWNEQMRPFMLSREVKHM